MRYFVGLDLGQAADYTALAVLERQEPAADATLPGGSAPPPLPPSPSWHPFEGQRYTAGQARALEADAAAKRERAEARARAAWFHGRHLERLPLGTPYPTIVAHVRALLETPALRGQTALVVDSTGVGRPVVDMLRTAGLGPVAISITAGDVVTQDGATWRVPKRDLVSAVQVELQTGRLKFAAELPMVPTLVQELLAFRVKITEAAHDTYGVWREGGHDDLVLAVAVAAWHGERWRPPRPPPALHGSRSFVTL